MPDTQTGRDLIALAERGDLGGCSFGFVVNAGGDAWDGTARDLHSVGLREVSIVQAWPAYADTEIHLRSLQPANHLAALHLWLDTVGVPKRSEEHTYDLQSLMRSSSAVFCLKKKKHNTPIIG